MVRIVQSNSIILRWLLALVASWLVCACGKQDTAPLLDPSTSRQEATGSSEAPEASEDEPFEVTSEVVAVGKKKASTASLPPAPSPGLPATVAAGHARKSEHVSREGAAKRPRADAQATELSAASDGASEQEAEEEHAGTASSEFNTERYAHVEENAFTPVAVSPLSTFSIDVDTASYANVRRMINSGSVVPPGAVRIEELVNYFSYEYPEPTGDVPFSVTTELSHAPWAPQHSLLLVGLQGRRVDVRQLPPRNLVFLLDVSGSMDSPNKLPLLKQSFSKLLDTMNPLDRVAIVVYAGASGLVLPSTPASRRDLILESLERLAAGGSTNGAAGIELAYQVAQEHAVRGGINRVILATDGDFNVGASSESALVELIEEKRKSGVFLTVLGFGMGNYNDSTLERLADSGNGNYAYIDTLEEATKVLVTEASGTLLTIAKDVKIQVEFNPAVVGAYRLIGYENRRLADRDFNDDRKDAGDIGAGHSVTALYELLTPAQARAVQGVDALKYQRVTPSPERKELLTVKLRYKEPEGSASKLLTHVVQNQGVALERASNNFRFASAVAAFGMYLRHSTYGGSSSPALAESLAGQAVDRDPHGYRREFLGLIRAVGGRGGLAVAR